MIYKCNDFYIYEANLDGFDNWSTERLEWVKQEADLYLISAIIVNDEVAECCWHARDVSIKCQMRLDEINGTEPDWIKLFK